MYQFESRVRYSETDEQGQLSLTSILNYFQDCSTFQSEDLGMGIQYLKDQDRAWWLTSWQIVIDRYPALGEKIRVSTWPYDFKGIYGYRNFVIEDLTGQRLVEADSTWFLLDLDSGLPCRVRQEDVGPYGEPGEKIPMEPAPKKISLPSIYEEGEPVMVRSHHIDTNHHVNNAQYVEIAREVVPGGTGRIRELRVEYKKAAVLGDVIYPKISREGGQITVLLQDGQGGSYAILWMRAV